MRSVEGQIRIQILQVPDCPLVGRLRELVQQALARIEVPVEVEDRIGDYPSPTLLIDGRDVTGRPSGGASACRLDLPTEQQVLAALWHLTGASGPGRPPPTRQILTDQSKSITTGTGCPAVPVDRRRS